MSNKKYKLTGEQLVKKIKRESLTVDDLIDHLTWLRDHYKKNGWRLPVKIEVVTYNKEATKSCRAVLDSWCTGSSTTENDGVLTLIAETDNPELVEIE